MSKKIIILVVAAVVILVIVLYSNISFDRNTVVKQGGQMSTQQAAPQNTDKGSYALNKLVTGSELEERADSWHDYEPISQELFFKMLEQHKRAKDEIGFKGLSVFNSSYKVDFIPDGDVKIIDSEARAILIDTVGDRSVSDAFTHVFIKKVDDLTLYFFLQSTYISNLLNDWNEKNSIDLYVFLPHVNHFSDQAPILVNRYDAN